MTSLTSPPIHAPMNQFRTDGANLIVGGMPLTRLAERAGQTPFYAYDRSVIQTRIAELRQTLPASIELHYAMKANPMPALVGFMAGLVDGIDVASGGELKVALDAGAAPDHISFAGPGKRLSELRQAVASGVLINVESEREIVLLEEISAALGQAARVAVRVNPDFELKGAGMKMGGGPKPFGIDTEQLPALLARIALSGLAFEGFHLFAGSQNLKAEAICAAQLQAYETIVRLAQNAPSTVHNINLGGGFGIPYFPGEQRLDVQPVANNLHLLAHRAQTDFPQATLTIELGRYLVGEAGIFVARIIDRKVSRGQTYLVVDGGLNHHLAASGNFGQVIRKNFPVAIGNRMNAAVQETVSIVGPLCTPLDILADRMSMPVAQPGDLVVVFQSGAYGASASPLSFLGHPHVIELLL